MLLRGLILYLIINLLLLHFQISDAFKNFGMGNKDHELLVVEIAESDKSTMSDIVKVIQGDQICSDELEKLGNKEQILKIYKITEAELRIGSLQDAVICRIASKDFVTF